MSKKFDRKAFVPVQTPKTIKINTNSQWLENLRSGVVRVDEVEGQTVKFTRLNNKGEPQFTSAMSITQFRNTHRQPAYLR